MSDSGKVLVDSSGAPLAGVGGIVLADRLYPTTVRLAFWEESTHDSWYREVVTPDPATDYGDNIWGASWQAGGNLQARRRFQAIQYSDNSIEYTNDAYQSIHRIGFTTKYKNYNELSIPWDRILPLYPNDFSVDWKARARIDLLNKNGSNYPSSGIYGRVLYSFGHAGITPSGSDAPWEDFPAGWTELFAWDTGSGGYQTKTIKPVPTSGDLWLACFIDRFTPNPTDYHVFDEGYGKGWDMLLECELVNEYVWSDRTITYNLAT